jgi:hypothetical protein
MKKTPLTAMQLWEFLTSLHEEGHDLENIKVLYRHDRDSDDVLVCAAEEDLYDMKTNSVLETIMLLTNPDQI